MPAIEANARLLEDLVAWLAVAGFPAGAPPRLLPGDVSLRRYARVELRSGERAIAAYYPGEIRVSQERFDRAAELLEGAGVAVPRRLATDPATGWSLVEDAGEETLYDARGESWAALEPRLAEAVGIAARIAGLDARAVASLGNPPLDRELLRRELRQTEKSVLAPAGALDDPAEAAALAAAFDALCEALAAEPVRACHRDFMARNLVPSGRGLVVLDFQDLRLGPAAYDLASLLNDSLFPPEAVERRLLETATGSAEPSAGYRRAVAQRALKAAGTFATFAARGSDRHLGLIPPTLARATRQLLELPETAAAWSAVLRRSGARLGFADGLLH